MKKISVLFSIMLMTLTFASSVFAIGAVADGEWVADGDKWKFVNNGQAVTNDWALIKQGDEYIYYYFDANSHMVTDITKIGDEYYSFDSNGAPTKKGKEIKCGEDSFKILNKGLIENFVDADYEEYVKEQAEKAAEKAANDAFQADQKKIKESIAASEAAYRAEHAAEIAAAEAAKEAEKQAKAAADAAKKAEAQAKYELLISTANREKLQAEANKGSSRKTAIRNLVTETKRQLNERRTQMISQAKTEFTTNKNANIDSLSDLFVEVVEEYASVLDDMVDALSYKYNMREESHDDAVAELAEVLSTAKARFAEDFAKIGETKEK